MLPETPQRVPAHTSDEVNRWIAQTTAASVNWHARHPDHIGPRLHELDREWDMERTLEANAATLALTGTLLGLFVDRRFLALPVAVTAFLLQHALQGWCPPVPFFRKLGVRTMREIDEERFALKALRGDFGPLGRVRTIATPRPATRFRRPTCDAAGPPHSRWAQRSHRPRRSSCGRKPVAHSGARSKVQRDVRNLVVAGMSAATLQVLERPLVDLLSRSVEECRWGLLKQVTLPPWLETLLAVALMDYTLYLWHVLIHAAVDGSYLSTVRGPPAELLDLAELQHRQSRLGDAVRSNLRLAF